MDQLLEYQETETTNHQPFERARRYRKANQ